MQKIEASGKGIKGIEPAAWVVEELAGARLGDRRLKRRAQIIMTQFSQQPTGTIPQACGEWNDIKAAYRFFANPAVQPLELLGAHSQSTVKRMQGQAVVLAVQDTTTLNYSTHAQTEGLGPISNNADRTVGLFLHGTLALTVTGEPLGLLAAAVRRRDPRQYGQNRKRNQKAMEQKESQRWLDSLTVCQQVAEQCPDTLIVNVADREGDIYELFEQALESKVQVLVRAQHNRRVAGTDRLLWEQVEQQTAAASLMIRVQRKVGQASRLAGLEVRFCEVRLEAPLLKADKQSLTVWAIEAREGKAPPGQKAILWRLLSTLPVNTLAAAEEKLSWYCQRWQIEVLHKVLKSGCRIEQRQLATAQRLERVLMVDLIVAWRIMLLSKAARTQPEALAADWLLETEWKVLWCHMKQQPPPTQSPSLRQAVRWIGKLGGFIGRKSDGEPGPIVLWRGLLRLHDLVAAWNLFQHMGKA